MNEFITYGILTVALLTLELLYFRFADRFNIIDKPNERSSHSTIVLRGGGVILCLSMVAWAVLVPLMLLNGRDSSISLGMTTGVGY